MISHALTVLKDGIQSYLVRLPELNIANDTKVSLSPVVSDNGTAAILPNTLGVTLVNVDEERITKAQTGMQVTADGNIRYVNPEIKLNLNVLIAANFADYETSLSYLSGAIRFFQSKSLFTIENTPALDPAIQRLVVDLISLNFEQQNNLWGSLGAKYLPSVLYRVRLLTIQESLSDEEQPPILEINSTQEHIQ